MLSQLKDKTDFSSMLSSRPARIHSSICFTFLQLLISTNWIESSPAIFQSTVILRLFAAVYSYLLSTTWCKWLESGMFVIGTGIDTAYIYIILKNDSAILTLLAHTILLFFISLFLICKIKQRIPCCADMCNEDDAPPGRSLISYHLTPLDSMPLDSTPPPSNRRHFRRLAPDAPHTTMMLEYYSGGSTPASHILDPHPDIQILPSYSSKLMRMCRNHDHFILDMTYIAMNTLMFIYQIIMCKNVAEACKNATTEKTTTTWFAQLC
jgi:hypothetical protein